MTCPKCGTPFDAHLLDCPNVRPRVKKIAKNGEWYEAPAFPSPFVRAEALQLELETIREQARQNRALLAEEIEKLKYEVEWLQRKIRNLSEE